MSDATDIFDVIARFVPPELEASYWRVISKTRDIPANDEVMLLITVMGIHTFILRDLPTELVKEREALVGKLQENQEEFSRLATMAKEQTIEATNEAERLAVGLVSLKDELRSVADQLREAATVAANHVDVETMSHRLTAELEERTIVPHARLIEQTSQSLTQLDEATATAKEAVAVWSKVHLKGVWIQAFTVSFCICGFLLFLAGCSMDQHYNAALDRHLKRLTNIVWENKEVVEQLARANVRLTTGIAYINGKPDPTTRYLMLRPAKSAKYVDEKDDPKVGVIFFAGS